MSARNWLEEILGTDPSACPDCNASRSVADLGPGITQVVVEHDPTCPRYRAMGGGEGR